MCLVQYSKHGTDLCGRYKCHIALVTLNADRGGSGVEFAGFSNDLTNAADARTDQSAQAIAYPHSIITPQNTLTCTQVRLALQVLSVSSLCTLQENG